MQTPTPIKRFQFTIGNLLLATVFLALYFVNCSATTDAIRLANENATLRKKLGYVSIEDTTKIQCIQLDSRWHGHWVWRIYVPAGKFNLNTRIREDQSGQDSTVSIPIDGPREFTFQLIATKHPKGDLAYLGLIDDAKQGELLANGLKGSHLEYLQHDLKVTHLHLDYSNQKAKENATFFDLFNVRFYSKGELTEDGIKVWINESR